MGRSRRPRARAHGHVHVGRPRGNDFGDGFPGVRRDDFENFSVGLHCAALSEPGPGVLVHPIPFCNINYLWLGL